MPEAGFDYFTTQAHHRSLASRILTVLGAFNVVVVTADRLSGGPMVCAALSEAAAGRYMVIGFPCEPDIDRHDVLRFRASLSESLPVGSTADRGSEAPPLIVFYDTDRYSDKQIEELFSYIDQRTQIGDHRIMAAVFLAPGSPNACWSRVCGSTNSARTKSRPLFTISYPRATQKKSSPMKPSLPLLTSAVAIQWS